MPTAYKCPNLGNCDKADQGEVIQIPVGAPATCPECRSNLITAAGGGGGAKLPPWLPIAAVALLLVLVGIGAWLFFNQEPEVPTCEPPAVLDAATHTCKLPVAGTEAPAPPPAAPICRPPEVLDPASGTCKAPAPARPAGAALLRFCGSNTIGGKLLPALAEAYLKQEGDADVHRAAGANAEETAVIGARNGGERRIEIEAHGSKTAFEGLKDGRCDIGMASRPIKPEEKAALAALGDLTANASEHVLALDGIAVIVHPANPVKALSLAQLADIFSGAVSDWSAVGGRPGPIALFARDEKSGTWDFFNDAVLKKYKKTLAAAAQRFEHGDKLAEAVAGEPGGIGFIGLNYVGANKVVALSDQGVEPRKPTLLTVKTEDYLLSRRLFLYTAERPANPEVFKFIEFALGSAAYPVIAAAGQVNPDPTPIKKTVEEQKDDPRNASAKWRALTAQARDEIPTRFGFRSGGSELDTRANRDIGRVVGVLGQDKYQGRPVLLIGFADASGAHAVNCRLSEERANVVKRELEMEGLAIGQVVGLCEEAPVRSNDTPEGREKNRRVEIWVK